MASPGSSTGWITKYVSTGEFRWALTPPDCTVMGISIPDTGEPVLAIAFWDQVILGTETFISHGNQDPMLATLAATVVSIEEGEQALDRMNVHPNPGSAIVHVLVDDLRSVQVVNMQGQVVHEEPFPARSAHALLQLEHLSNGAYVLRIGTDAGIRSTYWIKQP